MAKKTGFESPVKTYDAHAFLHRHMHAPPSGMLQQDFGRFFIVKVQDMIRLMKLPVPPSRSEAHTFILVTSGHASMSVGNTLYKVRPNECLFVPAGSIFSFGSHDKNTGFLLHFKNDLLHRKTAYDFLQPWGNLHLRPGRANMLPLLSICKRLYALYRQNGLQGTDLVQPYLWALLAEAGRVYKPAPQKAQASATHITNRFRALLFSSIASLQRVTDYAQALNISPNHLNKCVRSVTGKSPTKWIDEAIVLEAKALLHQSALGIGEIAAAVGIDDASYFSRMFKKHEGMSPLAFRKMIEKS